MSRTVTVWGYAVLASAAVLYQAFGLLTRRAPTLTEALTRLKRLPAARPLLLAGWLWVGWHTFVRGSVAP